MKRIAAILLALAASLPGVNQAATLTFGDFPLDPKDLTTANEVDSYAFFVTSPGSVNLYTTSAYPTNLLLTLWQYDGVGDYTQVALNDDRAGQNFFETINALDSKLVQNLGVGVYLATVTGFGNGPNGNLLSGGFAGNGTQNAGAGYVTYQLTVEGSGVVPAPIPAAVWMFGAGLAAVSRATKRKGASV